MWSRAVRTTGYGLGLIGALLMTGGGVMFLDAAGARAGLSATDQKIGLSVHPFLVVCDCLLPRLPRMHLLRPRLPAIAPPVIACEPDPVDGHDPCTDDREAVKRVPA